MLFFIIITTLSPAVRHQRKRHVLHLAWNNSKKFQIHIILHGFLDINTNSRLHTLA